MISTRKIYPIGIVKSMVKKVISKDRVELIVSYHITPSRNVSSIFVCLLLLLLLFFSTTTNERMFTDLLIIYLIDAFHPTNRNLCQRLFKTTTRCH